jgi:hypothetical protein
MAHPDFKLVNGDTFTFSNEHLTIAAETNLTNFPQEPLTVESVTLTFENPSPHDTLPLPVHDLVVPPHVVDHVLEQVGFDLLI